MSEFADAFSGRPSFACGIRLILVNFRPSAEPEFRRFPLNASPYLGEMTRWRTEAPFLDTLSFPKSRRRIPARAGRRDATDRAQVAANAAAYTCRQTGGPYPSTTWLFEHPIRPCAGLRW